MKSLLLIALSLVIGYEAALAEPTKRIFVTNENGNSVSVIDGRTNKVEATIDIGKQPRGIGIAPDGSEIYVAISEENAIAVLDPKSLKLLRTFKSGPDP